MVKQVFKHRDYIMRLFIGVFLLTLLVNPLHVFASGDSSSDNEADEEYDDWSDAFNDTDYKENLAENIARTWANYFVSYVGTREDVIDEIADYIGDSYDRTISLYDNLYDYILPYSRETVTNIDGSNLSIGVYGKPVRGKNNLKLINQYVKTMEDSLPTAITDIATNKYKDGSDMTYSDFPSFYHFSDKPYNTSSIVMNNGGSYIGSTKNMMWCVGSSYYRDLIAPSSDVYDYVYYSIGYLNGADTRYAMIGCYPNSCGTYRYYQVAQNLNWERTTNGDSAQYIQGYDPSIYIYGSGYIEYQFAYRQYKTYYWDLDTKSLYFLGVGRPSQFIGDDLGDPVKTYELNIINSVDFEDYTDLINQLIFDVNMENNISNSLLIEILNELRNQRDVYQPTSDDDDIYDYIDYIMQKLIDVKDIHIEIPDLTPNMNGIVDGITALLNFLASIIRTIGSLVETLLEGLFHLIVPTDTQWDEIELEFTQLTAPLDWIKDFFIEGSSAVSYCLFGEDVLNFGGSEATEAEIVYGNVIEEEGLIYFDNVTGAPKIPVHFSNSTSQYFSNIDTAYIIDMSWYAPYKPVGDTIVVAFCWLMFIWRVLHDLPNIIQGGSGITDNSTPESVKIENQTRDFKGVGVK